MVLSYTPAILDIEASGFGKGSFPIEIGVAAETSVIYSWLVKPEHDWVHWQQEAEQLHGISRQQLMDEGEPAVVIASQLNELFEGQTLYSDGWGFDSGWLSLLFYVAGKNMLFKLETLPRILSEYQLCHWDDKKTQIRSKKGFSLHRASEDAALLQLTYLETARDEQLSGQ